MRQDSASGSRANKWGRETAAWLAQELGGVKVRPGLTNEYEIAGEPAVIKSGRAALRVRVGVTPAILSRVTKIVGAFECDDGTIEVWALPVEDFRASMKIAQGGKGAGRLWFVSRATFEQSGRPLGRFLPPRS